jgi:hypothetical protein
MVIEEVEFSYMKFSQRCNSSPTMFQSNFTFKISFLTVPDDPKTVHRGAAPQAYPKLIPSMLVSTLSVG